MKVLFINQVYPPDPAATGQQQASLAKALVKQGHTVTVITSARGYDDPTAIYPSEEIIDGVRILRVWRTGLGKGAKWKRAIDFASYFLSCAWRALTLKRHDSIVTLTTPPLISILGAALSLLWRARYTYWVMDLNPDEAIAAGWLKENGCLARILEIISRISLKSASAVIALDHFMADRIAKKGISPQKIHALPPWSHDHTLRYDLAGRNAFRQAHGLQNRFVIMYSGNHSPCHPLDSLLQAALELKDDPDYLWCFVGGGTEKQKVEAFRDRYGMQNNMLILPYQPLETLSASLSAADLHCVVMGDGFVGTIHPCKIYNILSLGIPTLCIAPTPSHLTELAQAVNDPHSMRVASHGDLKSIQEALIEFKQLGKGRSEESLRNVAARYAEDILIPRHIDVIIGGAQ